MKGILCGYPNSAVQNAWAGVPWWQSELLSVRQIQSGSFPEFNTARGGITAEKGI
jgi:hypothetical protein